MTQQEIQNKRDEINLRLRIAKAAVTATLGELKGLQQICLHPEAEKWLHRDYTGITDNHFKCPDCGYSY